MPDFASDFDTMEDPFLRFARGAGTGVLDLVAAQMAEALAERAASAAALNFSRCFLCRWAFKPRRALRVGEMSFGVQIEHCSGFSHDTR
jgi:hypothetical protein